MPSTLGEVLRTQRRAAGLSRRELCERSAVPAVTIRHIEAGIIPNPGARHIARLAGALCVSADELLAPFCAPASVDDT